MWCTNSADGAGGGDPGSGYAFIMLANRAGTAAGGAPAYGDCCECGLCAEPFPEE